MSSTAELGESSRFGAPSGRANVLNILKGNGQISQLPCGREKGLKKLTSVIKGSKTLHSGRESV